MFNLFKKPTIPLAKPDRFPKRDGVQEWLDRVLEYEIQTNPNDLDKLFNPSSGEYIPMRIAIGISHGAMQESLECYREIKKNHPEAVKKAKENFQHWSHSSIGDKEDYPTG